MPLVLAARVVRLVAKAPRVRRGNQIWSSTIRLGAN